MRSFREAASGVYFVEGPASNWVVLRGATGVSLVDTGYPADFELVLESIREAGCHPAELETILITHGHSDHLGNARRLARQFGATVLCHPRELDNVTRRELHQVGVRDLLPHVMEPRVVAWAYHAYRAGGTSDVGVPEAVTFDPGETIVASGHRLRAIHAPAHTPGSCAYWIDQAKTLITGDALVTAHPTSRVTGPQLLRPMFHHGPSGAGTDIDQFVDLPVSSVLPGHGPMSTLRISMSEVVFTAHRAGSRRWRDEPAAEHSGDWGMVVQVIR